MFSSILILLFIFHRLIKIISSDITGIDEDLENLTRLSVYTYLYKIYNITQVLLKLKK